MGRLSKRETGLILLCVLVAFIMANIFVGLKIHRTLGGGKEEIRRLQDQLAENRMYLEERDLWDKRRAWMDANMPAPIQSTLNAQGALAQALQDELLDRKIKIERQNLQEPVTGNYYEEVAVSLRLRGEAAVINEWLATLQSPEKFQVIKNLTLELDTKSKEAEPQAVCNVSIARWFTPKGQALAVPPMTEIVTDPEPTPEPEPQPETTSPPEPAPPPAVPETTGTGPETTTTATPGPVIEASDDDSEPGTDDTSPAEAPETPESEEEKAPGGNTEKKTELT